ncbi:MAG: type II secretion system protein [Candidatus Sumerlaeia bacterium]
MASGIRRTQRGFTFVEVLAGMLFMAIVLPVAIEGISLSHRVGVVADRKREAGRLAQMILDEAVATGTWRDGDQNQEFGEDWPGYRWHLTSVDWTETGLSEVTAEVTFNLLGRDYGVALTTITETEDASTDSGTTETGTGSSGSGSSSGFGSTGFSLGSTRSGS